MNRSKPWLLAASLALSAAGAASAAGVPGTLDPATGAFTPARPPAATKPSATTHGTFVVAFNISTVSPLAAATPITCTVSVTIGLDGYVNGQITETASVTAARNGPGTIASCQVKIPYNWTGFAATDTAQITYDISAVGAKGTTSRDANRPITTIAVPAAGATTAFTVDATI